MREGVENKALPCLDKNITCDILIIGGGVAGLSTAYFLSQENSKNIVLIDKDVCGSGASSKNTGKLTYMQGLVYHKIAQNYTVNEAKKYLQSQIEAISIAKEITTKHHIDCNLEKTTACIFSLDANDKDKFIRERKFYEENHLECSSISKLDINFPIKFGIKTEDSYRFNPYKFLVGLKNYLTSQIKIYEKTRCIETKREGNYYLSKLENGKVIKSNFLVVATQYPFFVMPYFTPFKTTVEKSFIVCGEHEIKDFQAISEGKPTFSFNFYNDKKKYLVYSRRSHSTTNNLDTRDDYREITSEYQKYFSQSPTYYFQNHDLMTYDYLPFIGKIDKNNMYVLTGFNKWGNTNGLIGGKVISDLITKGKSPYEKIFCPQRSISFLKIKNLMVYNFQTAYRYLLNKVSSNQSYYDKNVQITNIKGKKCGIYIDEKGQKHIVSNICPHLKCNLVFNYVDKTWDCPCHASRFDIDGNIINGPSVYTIKLNNDNND